MPARPRIVCVLTSSLGLGFLRGQLAYLRQAGYDVTVVSSPGDELTRAGQVEGVQIKPIPIAREVSPLSDLMPPPTLHNERWNPEGRFIRRFGRLSCGSSMPILYSSGTPA